MTAIVVGRGALLFERNLMVYRRAWLMILSGFFEPLFYLFSMGIGLGHYVGKVPVAGAGLVSYGSFVAPAQECPVDKVGRMLIPPPLREHAGLLDEVTWAGTVERIEIWSPALMPAPCPAVTTPRLTVLVVASACAVTVAPTAVAISVMPA